jgi:lactaldehyde dehydrogenase/glycolaldehyde dehydrogenase
LGGKRAEFSDKALRGHFFQATILTDVRQDMDIMKEEIFGPVLPVYKFTTEDEVCVCLFELVHALHQSAVVSDPFWSLPCETVLHLGALVSSPCSGRR